MTDLRERYTGIEAVLGDVTVARDISGRLHRPDEDGDPWCRSTGEVEYVETSIALGYGARLCKSCYRPALAHLARMEATPVEDTAKPTPNPPAVEATPEFDKARPDPLGALTAEVLVATGGAGTFHAPSGDGTPFCGLSVTTTRREPHKTPPSARPCRRCFAERVVEEYAPRDADLVEVTETATDGGRS
jgi:hypothetical protein